MANILKEVETFLSSEVIKQLFSSNISKIGQLNAVIALLIKAGIPFDVSFTPGTRRVAASAQLTIYINPTTTIQFSIAFEAGTTIF